MPKELADELRDADPSSGEVSDSSPHRPAVFRDTDSEVGVAVWGEIEEASTLIPSAIAA
ncbi:MAG: hypothetical protein ABJC04_00250 [Verrucomicrobiota bacterium]